MSISAWPGDPARTAFATSLSTQSSANLKLRRGGSNASLAASERGGTEGGDRGTESGSVGGSKLGTPRAQSGGVLALNMENPLTATGGPGPGEGAATTRYRVRAGKKLVYWEDWLSVLFLLAMLVLSEYHGTPYQRFETEADLASLGFPHSEHNTVPSWVVPIIALVGPLVVMLLFHCASGRSLSGIEAHQAVLGLFTGVMLTAVITNTAKITVGRLRPDFNSRCWPDGNKIFNNSDGFPECTNDNLGIVHEGRKSWPSGHTSWSSAGLGYLSWWLFAKLRVFDGSGRSSRLLLAMGPLLVATYIGLTRVKDYWHHPTDVLTGWLLGLTVSYLAFRQHYPNFFTTNHPDVPLVLRATQQGSAAMDEYSHMPAAMSPEPHEPASSDTHTWNTPNLA